MSSITELATKVRNLAGAYPAEFEPENPRFEASIETEQGSTMRVRCKGDQASILALAKRLEAGESKRKKQLRHPTPLRSHVNLNSRAFSEQTFRDLSVDDPAGAVQYAENAGREVAFNAAGEPMLVLKRPDCLADFPDLVLAMKGTRPDGRTGVAEAAIYTVTHLHSGKSAASPDKAGKSAAIDAFEQQREKRGDEIIHKAIRQNHDPDFQTNKRQALLGDENHDGE